MHVPEWTTHLAIIFGGASTIIGALWLMIRSFVSSAEKREHRQENAIDELSKYIRTVMHGCIESNTSALLEHTQSLRESAGVTRELQKEVHALRLEASRRDRRKRDDDSQSGINLGGD